MRTTAEIVARAAKSENDFFGFTRGVLLSHLPFADAKPYLVEDATEAEWTTLPTDRESIVAEIRDYLPFAWEKAQDKRGLSAIRSLQKMAAWVWLAGDDDLLPAIEHATGYGEDALAAISRRYDCAVPAA